jgi:hypothetical protein
MKGRLLLVAAAAAWTLALQNAAAIEPLGAPDLKEICTPAKIDPAAPDARQCILYVKGFLDGAVATDGRVAENVASEIEREETFTERAIRTRVINRLEKYGPSAYAEFCVGRPDPIADVVLHVIEELDRYEDLEGVQAQTVVYASLRRHYPCEIE